MAEVGRQGERMPPRFWPHPYCLPPQIFGSHVIAPPPDFQTLRHAWLWFGLGGLAKCLVASLEAMQRWNKKKAKIVRLPRYSFMLLSQLRIEVRIEWSTFCDLKNKTEMAYSFIGYMAARLISA